MFRSPNVCFGLVVGLVFGGARISLLHPSHNLSGNRRVVTSRDINVTNRDLGINLKATRG